MQKKVYFIPATGEESPENISKKIESLYLQLGLQEFIERGMFVALKIHFGEKDNIGHIQPPWLSGLIKQIKKRDARVFFTETNTLYVGSRSNSVDHLKLAEKHGFSLEKTGIPIVIADGLIGRDDDEIKVNLPRIETAKVGSAILNSEMMICLSHFTGHIQTGVGAAIKNLGMGCASRAGKLEQHSDVNVKVNPKVCTNCSICFDYCPADAIQEREGSAFIIDEKCIGCGECLVVCNIGAIKMRWDDNAIRVQEKMAEYAYAVKSVFDGKIGFINVLIRVTKDCDCMSKKGEIIADDVGILASLDPVALDKASIDKIIERSGLDVFKDAHDRDWSIQLKHGEKIGLGSQDYDLIELDIENTPE
ncbi:MAG: DUF362 domain-containing protein [Candidatus Aminicenantes bacterium]|nr:DUF362 domain-containing protein [Candidatus Aminicenantes bacterium]